ncbi:MAG: putative signal transduction protein [Phycisphaerales bacterium]|nr:putative signal transduction protein [Phycisphaerales bacterium]
MLIPLCIATAFMIMAVVAARAYARAAAREVLEESAPRAELLPVVHPSAGAADPGNADGVDKSQFKWRMRPQAGGYSVSIAVMDEVSTALQSVPPFPQALLRVARELDSAGSSAKSVADILASDPVLTASILRIANSASTGLRGEVVTVAQAVSYIGFSMTKSLFLRLQVGALLPRGGGGGGYDSEKLWGHSMAVAQAAEELARRAGGTDPQLALTAGLLHDIGKVAINCHFPDRVRELWAPGSENESFLARERKLFGADHAVLGTHLAKLWKLPEELIEMIRLHHLPPGEPINLSPEARRALLAVFIANQLVKYCHPYCEGMEIDVIPTELTTELGLPNATEELLDTRMRDIITRALTLGGASAATPPPKKAAA